MELTKQQARRLLLAHQGLWPSDGFQGKKGVLDYIRHVGCIQFDALDIVGRNPELVLQSRVPDFKPEMLYDLLYRERRLLDGLDKEMSIYCVEDWPYFRRNREHAVEWLGNDSRPAVDFLPQVRKEIEERGPLSSADLSFDQTVSWAWGPTRLSRAALESMYHWGELIVHHKVKNRKVYDFSHRHIDEGLLKAPDPNRTDAEYYDWYALRRVGAVGLLWNKAGDAWRGIRGINSRERNDSLTRLREQDKIREFHVEGIGYPFYMRSEDTQMLETETCAPRTAVLAPLDNMLWDRQMVKELFDFEYRWEVYKPVHERRYGYYVLPVLYGDRFIARFEPGRDKRSGALVVKNWWWEDGVTSSEEMRSELRRCFDRFLEYLGADTLQIDDSLVKREGLEWICR